MSSECIGRAYCVHVSVHRCVRACVLANATNNKWIFMQMSRYYVCSCVGFLRSRRDLHLKLGYVVLDDRKNAELMAMDCFLSLAINLLCCGARDAEKKTEFISN